MAIVPEEDGSARPDTDENVGEMFARPPADLLRRLEADIASAGGEQPPGPGVEGSIGATMFDLPGSEDNSVTVLLPQGQVAAGARRSRWCASRAARGTAGRTSASSPPGRSPSRTACGPTRTCS